MRIPIAGCLITDDYERILLLHRNTNSQHVWELPGGKLEDDELPAEAAIRELYEELGVNVQLTGELGSAEFEQGDDEYSYFWFRAVIIGGEPSVKEPHTFDDVAYFDFDDVAALALSTNMQILLEKLVSGEVSLTPEDPDDIDL
jgi:8-oxo-dGTP diphosphatase